VQRLTNAAAAAIVPLPATATQAASAPWSTLTTKELTWRVDVSGEFARQLFDQKSHPLATPPRPRRDAAG
jgi:hypothetical protein